MCKTNAVEGTLFCNGHTCPAQGCTAGKSTKIETFPARVHGSHGGGGPESGEVFYDSSGIPDVTGAEQQLQPSATTAGAGDAIYVVSAKTGARLVKQQQAALDANATYAAPMRRVPEQDYVASSEMLRNEKACLMYDLPTASATTSIDVGTAVLQCQSQPKLVLEWCCWGQRPRGWMATGMVRESKKRRRRRRGGAPHQGSVYLGFAADNEESMP